ncbi:MAG: hypothetical protein ACI8RD_003141 [Bacillariaceae sp.]
MSTTNTNIDDIIINVVVVDGASMSMGGSSCRGKEISVVTKGDSTNISVNTTRSSGRKKHPRSTLDLSIDVKLEIRYGLCEKNKERKKDQYSDKTCKHKKDCYYYYYYYY